MANFYSGMDNLQSVVNDWAGSSTGFATFDIEATELARDTITFQTGAPPVEMLKVGKDGFWVRGVKVEQDDKEAEIVYNAFKQWMMWSELNRR
jgi:uncharacterized protein YprB with RNaseH-like and TPR domain